MKYNFLIFCVLISVFTKAQVDSVKSIYTNLEVRKFYNVTLKIDSLNGKAVYKADGKEISKATYDKFQSTRKNVENCRPCIIETYNANEKLLFKADKYEDCPVGQWIVYYPSGKIKEIGHYRQNDTGNWDDMWNSAYCIKHGRWTYYDEKGKPTKTEMYDFGNLKEK